MKTTNWQTKALTLFIAAVALWLATACDNADSTTESPPSPAVTATSTQAPIAATPTPQVGCTHETPELTSRLNTSEAEYQELIDHRRSVSTVQRKYQELFWRQPNVHDVNPGFLRDGKGGWTDEWGITVWVTEKVDQSSLPPGFQIPDTLDNVPIQIIEPEPLPVASESRCDISLCGVKIKEGGSSTTVNTPERRRQVRNKYDPLFWRQPNVHGVGLGRIRDEKGEVTNTWGISVFVAKRVDQRRLPPEDRLPDCLEGIPIQIIVQQPVPLG